jgi:hypothetical protein
MEPGHLSSSGPDLPSVVIVVLNWNGWRDTLDCLKSLTRLAYPRFRVVVMDNGSRDDSVKRIRNWSENNGIVFADVSVERRSDDGLKAADTMGEETVDREGTGLTPGNAGMDIRLIAMKGNLGFAEGNNVVIRHILKEFHPPDYILLLNNDAWVERECLSEAVATARNMDASIVGCLIKDAAGERVLFSGDNRPPGAFYMRSFRRPHGNPLMDELSTQVNGCAMLIRREALEAHRRRYGYYMNPKLFLYGEETQFCLQTLKLGLRIAVSKKAVAYHKVSRSTPENQKGTMFLYYTTRNSYLIGTSVLSGWDLQFFRLNYPFARIRVILWKLLMGRSREAFAVAEGLRDGYAGVTGQWRKQG